MTLTARQARFVNEYVNSLNGTQAAIAAGYSPKTARAIASENLRKLSIQAEITNQERLRKTRLNAAQEILVREILKILEADFSKMFDERGAVLPMALWPPEIWGIVASFKYGPARNNKQLMRASIKLHDRFKVLKLPAERTGAIDRRTNLKRRPSKR